MFGIQQKRAENNVNNVTGMFPTYNPHKSPKKEKINASSGETMKEHM
jgi:hypothetical protein